MACYEREAANTFGFIGLKKIIGATALSDLANLDVCPIALVTPAPTAFQFTATTAFTADASCVSLEANFRWEIATDSGFVSIVQTINNSATTVQFTGLDQNTLYYGRVKATGPPQSAFSNTDSDTTLFANPLDLFGSNLHAWFDGNTVVLNGNDVSQWTDLSGNGKHIEQATAANQPKHGSTNPGTDTDLDGTEGVYFSTGSGVRWLDDIGNWAGLGTDPYFVVIIERFSNILPGNANSPQFGRNDGGDNNNGDTPHIYWHGGSNDYSAMTVQTSAAINYREIESATRIRSVALTARGANHALWDDGTIVTSFAVDAEGAVVDAFNTMRVGAYANDSASNASARIYEMMFIKGDPEDYGLVGGDAFNQLHTGYLTNKYPSLIIADPNLA